MVVRQNADIGDIANTLRLGDVAMATTFWLSTGYNFGCVIASDTLLDSMGWIFGVKLSDEDSRLRGSNGRCNGNHFYGFLYMVHIGLPGEYD